MKIVIARALHWAGLRKKEEDLNLSKFQSSFKTFRFITLKCKMNPRAILRMSQIFKFISRLFAFLIIANHSNLNPQTLMQTKDLLADI